MRTGRVALELCLGLLLGAFGSGAAPASAAPDPTAAIASLSWGEEAVRASRRDLASPPAPGAPAASSHDPLDAMVVVEDGGASLAVVDGRTVELRGRIALPSRPLLGPPRFSPDGRFAYVGSLDGWVSMVDLVGLRVVAEVRVGERLQDFALSGDGRWLMASNASPHSLVLLRTDLSLERIYAVRSADGRRDGTAAVVVDAAARQCFVVALNGLEELWEISYDPQAEGIFDGMVHDYRMGEGIARQGFLGVRRTKLARPLASLFIDPIQAHALGHAGEGPGDVVNLDVRRRIESLPVDAPLRPASLAVSLHDGARLLVAPVAGQPWLQVIDMKSWRRLTRVTLPGPALQVRTHSRSAWLWAALAADGAAAGGVAVVDKPGWRLVSVLSQPGAVAVDLALGREGRRLWVIWRAIGMRHDNSLLVYDDGQPVLDHRLPLSRPDAIHGVANAIQRAQGRVP